MVYFWRDLGGAFSEIARVIKPGGRLALLFTTSASRAVDAFPADVYRFPTLDEITATLRDTGFIVETVDAASERTSPVLVTATKT